MLAVESCRRVEPAKARESRRGAAVVETAVVLPVFILVVLGMIEVGRAIMVAQLVENAAREAARSAIISGSTNQSVTDVATSSLQNSANVSAGSVGVTINVAGISGGSVATAQPRDLITVTVSVPYSSVSWLPPNYMAGKSLTATCAMRHE